VRETTRAGQGEVHQRLSPGEMLGDYSVRRRIYLDSLVSYYIIRDQETDQELPIGVFHPLVSDDSEFSNRLRRLIQALSATEELAICLIRKHEVIDGLHCVFFEPVHGRSLQGKVDEARIVSKSGLGAETTVHIVRQVLAGLHDAHSHSIHHRSLDPCLIFEADDATIQILGFGLYDVLGKELIAKIHSNNSLLNDSASGKESPELKVYKERLRRLSDDVYGTSNLGYQLLQGHSPKYIDGELSRLDLENLPPKWRAFFKKTLILKSDKRMRSLADIDRRLDKISDENSNDFWYKVRNFYDHLPVPRSVRSRGVYACRFYWAGRVIVLALAFALISIRFIEPVAIDYVESRQPVAVEKRPTEPFDVAFNFLQEGASIELLDHDSRFAVSGRQLLLDLRSGSYRVKVTAAGFLPAFSDFVVERGSLETDVEPIDIDFDLLPLEKGIYIESVVDAGVYSQTELGALVELGRIDKYGNFLLLEESFAGATALTVQKDGFNPRTVSRGLMQIGQRPSLMVNLEPIAAVLSVDSSPSAASIFLNGELVGSTPHTLDGLDPDLDYEVRVELSGYHAVNRSVDLGPDEFFELDIGPMSLLNSGTLAVQPKFKNAPLESVDELSAFLSFKIAGINSEMGNLRLANIPEGNHVLKVEHPLFESSTSRVVIKDGGVLKSQIELSPKLAVIEFIYDDTLPIECEMNGIPVELRNKTLEIPAYNVVKVGLVIKDHYTVRTEFTLNPTERFEFNVDPTPIPGPVLGATWSVPYLNMEFCWVPPGQGSIGSPATESGRLPNEPYQYTVKASQGYWMGAFEVTQSEYHRLMGHNPSDFIGARHPVENVSWFDAMKYCANLNEIEAKAGRLPPGYAYQLPAELEWEFAMRGGGATTPFVFGEKATPLDGNFRGYYPSNYIPEAPIKGEFNTVSVGSYKSSSLGVFDTHGNVAEWTRDGFQARRSGEVSIPLNIEDDSAQAAVRGGSWQAPAMRSRVASRRGILISEGNNFVGFRVVLSPVNINFN